MKEIITLRGLTLHVFYTFYEEDDGNVIDIDSVMLDNNDITDLCDYYRIFPDIYDLIY